MKWHVVWRNDDEPVNRTGYSMYSQFSDNAKWGLKPRRNRTLANPAAASCKMQDLRGFLILVYFRQIMLAIHLKRFKLSL